MSLRPELFRELAALRRLPAGEEDFRAWHKAYEAIEEALALFEDETFTREEPVLVFHPGESVPAAGRAHATSISPHRAGGEIAELSLTTAASLIHRKELSPVELVRAVLDRIDAYGKRINAYIALHAEDAIQAARQAEDALVHRHPLGPLHGVPLAVKDLFFEAGRPTTAGSRVLQDFVPQEDATVIRRLREAGAILLGRLNLHELAYGVTNENPHFGPVRNPWNPGRIAGGSSGGSAAAVAASLCLASLGTDTGGSIRIPAACCGVVGVKPTYGRVSRHGVLPLAWSLDHVGPITKSVEDAALLLEVLAGFDPRDPTTSPVPVPAYSRVLGGGLEGVRVGVPKDFFTDPAEIDPAVLAAVQGAIHAMEGMGASTVEVSVPSLRDAPAVQFLTIATEASANHGGLLRTRGRDLGLDVRRRLELGEFIAAPLYVRAQQARRRLIREFADVFRHADLVVMPTLPVVAPSLGAESVAIQGVQKRIQPTLTRFTSPLNLTGLPAISVPCGFDSGGLPVGLQIVGRPFDEATVLRGAFVYEQASTWHTRHPPLVDR
jgi:aspartyl-tRNA(Asn)/glutamyl-tRNA(Gln) amidotransferase subunit A